MNAQTPGTREDMSGQDPGTPVVIKTGSNGPPGSNKIEIIIDSRYMPFNEFVKEPDKEVWKSQSVFKGRIHKLSILENAETKPEEKKQPYPQELASVTIEYWSKSLVISELGNTADQDVVLEIRSVGAPFEVETAGPWNTARAWLPRPSHVVFKAGEQRLVDRDLDDTYPTLIIEFPKPSVG